MHTETAQILVGLLVVFTAGKIAGELFERIGQPAVIGELIAGMIIGPAALGLVHISPTIETVATMGVVILMFAVGLETKASELFSVGRTAMLVAVLGVVLPLMAGLGFGSVLGMPRTESLFVGTALVATSVGITARVLSDKGLVSSRVAKIILAAAVIDDVLGMLVLSIVSGTSAGGAVGPHLLFVLGQVVVFIGFELFVAPRLVANHGHHVDRLRIRNAPFAVAIITMLGLAALAEYIGLAGIVGAFFAGMMFAETSERWELEQQTRPLYDWLVPYFFVVTGARVDVAALSKPEVLIPGLVLTVIAVVTKVVGCGLGALSEGRQAALAVGVGMVPRGEVGLIVASVGLAAGILSAPVYAMVVLVVIVSTLVVPPVLPALFSRPAAIKHPIKLPAAERLANLEPESTG